MLKRNYCNLSIVMCRAITKLGITLQYKGFQKKLAIKKNVPNFMFLNLTTDITILL